MRMTGIPMRCPAPWPAMLAATLLIGATEGSAQAEHMMDERTVEGEVLEVIRGFNDAFAANDPDRYFSYVAEEIVVLVPSSPYRVEGIIADREEFEWGLRTGRTRIGYFQELQPDVRVYGNTAVVTYYSRGSYGADETVAYLKETDVLVRRAGDWKIVHIHVSATAR